MSSSTDTFNFNEEKLFQVIRDCLPDDLSNTQNLICVFDDILYAWNSKNCCVLSLNWRLNRVKEPNHVAYQVSGNFLYHFRIYEISSTFHWQNECKEMFEVMLFFAGKSKRFLLNSPQFVTQLKMIHDDLIKCKDAT